MISNTASILVC